MHDSRDKTTDFYCVSTTVPFGNLTARLDSTPFLDGLPIGYGGPIFQPAKID